MRTTFTYFNICVHLCSVGPASRHRTCLSIRILEIEPFTNRSFSDVDHSNLLTMQRMTWMHNSHMTRRSWQYRLHLAPQFKNNGSHMKHNFGHGHQGLSNLLLTLNLISFACHTVCDQVCTLWNPARSRISKRQRFFTTKIVLNNYIYFVDWEQLLPRLAQPPRAPP